jgi:hypothetical protein
VRGRALATVARMSHPAGEGEGMRRMTRRTVLRDGTVLAVALFVARGGAGVAVAVEPGTTVFLTDAELATLRAAVDRFVPGRPEDADERAVAAGCAEAIDALLGAFEVDPPRIYAGAPFSDRGGSPVNHFEDFLPLDPYEEKGWRLRVLGSQGQPKLEFNGPVAGWQRTYRDGIAALDRAAAPARFADLPGPARDMILESDDPQIAALVDVAAPHALQFMYGAPEYGGNRELLGWDFTDYQGDTLPRGWTREEIEQPNGTGLSELQPRPPIAIPIDELLAYVPLAAPEQGHGLVSAHGESMSALRAALAPVVRRAGGRDGR